MKKTAFAKLMAMVLVFVMSIGIMAACGSKAATPTATQSAQTSGSTDKANKKIKIGCTVYYMSEFITLMKKGVEAEAKAQNADLIFLDANNDVNKQMSQIENLIAQKVDVLLVAAVDSDAIVPALDMAKKANIPLVGVNMLINTKEPYYYAGPNDVQAGELEAKYLCDKLNNKGNIVILDGPIGVSAQLQRKEGNHNIVDKLPGIKVLAEQPADWNREKALQLMENWLETYKGKIDGVIAHNDEMALGAIQALQAKGLKDKIPVVGVDAIKDACLSIKDGVQDMTVFQDAEKEGALGVQIAAKVARGEKVEPMQQMIEMKSITKDNVDTLLNTIYK